MSVGVHFKVEPEAIDPSDVEDFVNDHLARNGLLDRPLSKAAYAALFRHSDGNRHLLSTLSSLAVFLARLESASQVESSHVDAAAWSRSEVELTEGLSSTVTADAEAKLVTSKSGRSTSLHGRLYAGIAAVMMACLAIGLSYALSRSRLAAPAPGGPLQGVDVTTMAPAPPALASIDPPSDPRPVAPMAGPPPKASSSNDTEATIANSDSQADASPGQRTPPSEGSGAASGTVMATASNARDVPPPLSHVLVTFGPGDAGARERAMRLARYLRDHGYDAETGPLAEGGRHTGHVEYFFGADASTAAGIATFLGGGFGGAMLTSSRPDQRRPGTIEIAMPSRKAAPSPKAAPPTTDPFELWHVGRD